ncbi:UNVERIFIED_CONTAM: hypothetical protein FKN15_048601 [Acipenser sinensis]
MPTAPAIKLRVFSLNCWGIRYLSQHCSERYEMIGQLLKEEEHDLVLLQEVWSENDYLFLKKTLAHSHPYTHYFKSGVIGSGLAVFSKHKILDTFLYRYSINGYPYMAHHGDWFGGKAVGMVVLDICDLTVHAYVTHAHHGDWFGGKAVGMVVLDICDLTVHAYVTHLHAEYCREKDAYLPHRVVQAWELLHFVRLTSGGADLVILGGDLNMHPRDLGTRLLLAYTGLQDSYVEAERFEGCEEGITLIAENPFINKKELEPFENGIRIDYILFKVGLIPSTAQVCAVTALCCDALASCTACVLLNS